MTIETCAKVNLTLEVLGRRPDGFHELATIFQAVDLCDRIELTPATRLGVTVQGQRLPTDERNLCWRAAELLAAEAGRPPGVHIHLCKRVPIGGGLGGGSANAAGVLGALNLMWELGLPTAEVERLASQLGSDCAFFVRGGAAVGEGRGEALRPLPVPPNLHLVVLGPALPVSTAAVYRQLQGFREDAGEATAALAAAFEQGDVPDPAVWLVNDLEEPAKAVSAALARDASGLAAIAPGRHRLSGSGGSWFMVALDRAEAREWVRQARLHWPGRLALQTEPLSWGWRRVAEERDA